MDTHPAPPSTPRPSRRLRRWLLLVAAAGVVLAAAGVAAWFFLQAYGPSLTRERLEALLSQALERPVEIEGLVLRPWLGRIALQNVRVAAGPTWQGTPLLRLGRGEVTVGISSLWRREIVLSRILLEDLALDLVAGDGEAPAAPLMLPERIQAGPVSIGIRLVALRRADVTYRDPAARLDLAIRGLEAAVRPGGGGMGVTLKAAAIRLDSPGLQESVERLEGEGRVLPDLLAVRRLTARWRGREFRLSGDVRHPLSAPELDVRVRGALELAEVGRLAGLDVNVAGVATAEADVRGSMAEPTLAMQVTVPELTAGPVVARAVRVSGEVRGPLAAPHLHLAVRGDVDLTHLGQQVESTWPLVGTAKTEATLRGQIETLEVTGRVSVPDLTVGPVRAQQVALRGEWRDGTLRAEEISARAFGGRLRGSLVLDPDRLQATRATIALRDVSLPALDALAPQPVGIQGRLDLDAELAGDPRRPEALRGRARLAGRAIKLPGALERAGTGSLSAEGTFRGTAVRLARAGGQWPGLRFTLAGGLGPDGPAALQLRLDADLGPVASAWGWTGYTGAATLSADAGGRWDDPAVTGRLRVPQLGLPGVRLDGVDVSFRLQGPRLEVRSAGATLGQSRVTAAGSASWGVFPPAGAAQGKAPRFSIDLRAPALRLEDLAPWIPAAWRGTGSLTVAGSLEGTPAAWRGAGRVEAQQLTGPERTPLRDLAAEFRLDPDQVEVRGLRAWVRGIPISGHGAWAWRGAGQAVLDLGPAELAALPELPERLRLQGTARARVQATLQAGAVAAGGTVHLTTVSVAGLPLGDGTLTLDLQKDRLAAQLALPASRLTVAVTGRLGAGEALMVRLDLADLALEPVIRQLAQENGIPAAGSLSARAAFTVPLGDPAAARGTLTLDPVHLVLADERWESREPIRLRWETGALHVDRLTVGSRLGSVTASGRLNPTGPLDLTVGGHFPLAILPALRPEIREADGILEVTARLTGTAAQPRLTGEGAVRDATLQLRDYPEALRQVQARVLVSPSGLRVVELTASLGRGRIQATGEVALDGWQPRLYQFTLTGRALSPHGVERLETAWDLELELVGLGAQAQLSGEARLVRGSYTGDLSLRSLLLGRRAGPSAAPAFALPLRILLKLEQDLVVQTELARLRLGGELSLEGTSAAPILFGTLEVRQGQILFRKHRFTLTSASARFDDPRRIDPILDVQGTARIRNYDVTMRLSGRAENLDVRLSSVPALPQEDLLTLVAFGVTREEFGRSAAGIVAGEAAQLLVQDLLGVKSGGVGLDVMEVETTGPGERTLRVGKSLGAKTLLIYEQSLGGAGSQKLRVEYQLLGPLLVAGEQDFEQGYGVDLLLRLRFR